MEEEVNGDGSPTEMFCGRVMHVLDPQNFWVQIGTQENFDNFSNLEDLFQEFCDKVGTFPAGPAGLVKDGCYVLVSVTHSAQAAKCKRAQVARTNREKGTIDVFYLDYGNTELVTTDRLCQAVPSYFFAVKLELMKCGLAGIRPIAKTWTGRGIKCFEKLTKEQILQAAIISFQPLQMLYEISLYSQEDDHKSITHLLLEEEIGMPTDTLDSIPEFAKDVTQALPDSYYELYNHGVQEEHDEDDTTFLQHSECDIQENDTDGHKTSSQPEDKAHKELPSLQVSPKKSFHRNDGDVVEKSCPVSPDTPISPAITIPGFDLSEIFKTTMACADTLEKKKDDERRKETKIELQRSIKNINEDVPRPSASATWEMTDLIIGKEIPHRNDGTISDKIAQIEEVTGSLAEITESSHIIPAKITAAVTESVNQSEDPGSSSVNNSFPLLPCWTDSDVEDKAAERLDADHSEDDSDDTESQLVEQMTEIELYEFSKQLQKILLQNGSSDAMTVCAEFHSIVLVDRGRQPVGLPAVLDVLVEHAVKNSICQELALSVLDSYCECANFGNCLEKVLKDSHTRFIRVPPGKTSGYHSDFAQVLGQIFLYSRLWSGSQGDVIQQYVVTACEKWVVFNKNNTQMGQRIKRLMEVYDECFEAFWNIAGDVMHEVFPTRHRSLQAEVRDKILSANIDRNARHRYLVLLLSMQQPGVRMDLSKPSTQDTYSQTDRQSTANVQVQTEEELAPRLIPYIIPNVRTGRISDESRGSPSAAVNMVRSPPSTSLTEELSRYRSWAQCVTGAKIDTSTSPFGRTNQLKHLALNKLGPERRSRNSREIPPRFLKTHLNGDNDATNRSPRTQRGDATWRRNGGDAESSTTPLENSGRPGEESRYSVGLRSENSNVDWFESEHAALDALLETAVPRSKSSDRDSPNSPVRRRYGSSPQCSNMGSLDTSASLESNCDYTSSNKSSPASRNSPASALVSSRYSRSPTVNDSVPEKHGEQDGSNPSTSPAISPVVRDTPVHSRKKSGSPFSKDAKFPKPENPSLDDALTERYLKKDPSSPAFRERKCESKSRSESPRLNNATMVTKQSVKSIDSVSEKYAPPRLRKSNKSGVQKEANPVLVKKKAELVDWWEAGDSFELNNSSAAHMSSSSLAYRDDRKQVPILDHGKNRSPQKKVTKACDSLSSIVQDVFGGGESKRADLFEEHDEQASVTDTSSDGFESWVGLETEEEVKTKDVTDLTDKKNSFTLQHDSDACATERENSDDFTTTDTKPVRTPSDYSYGLGFDYDFDDVDDNFVLDFKDVDESWNSGDVLPSSNQVNSRESPTKSVRTYSWVPGKRRCTMCGSKDHVAYSCPQRSKRQIMN